MENAALSSIVKEIKKKKEISGIKDSLVVETLSLVLKRQNLSENDLEKVKSFDRKLIVKEVRSILRLMHARFQSSSKNRDKMIDEGNFEQLLKSHSSTKERLSSYDQLKSLIDGLKVSSILDLGCGLNPIALGSSKIKYYAYDINENELSLIKKYFAEKNITGKVSSFDLSKTEEYSFPEADICLVLKVLDLFGKRKYEVTEAILKKIKCKYFLISFSTAKLSGKSMNNPIRKWFESILERNNYSFEIINTSNEIFYLIKNPSAEI